MNFITGEKFQIYCDLFICELNDFNYNPNIKNNYKDKLLLISTYKKNTKIDNPKNIFIYTHTLYNNFENLYHILSNCLNKFNLYIHNSDHSLNKNHYITLIKNNNLINIYSQNINMNILDNLNNLKPLPIGIPNVMWPHGNPTILNNVINQNIEKKNFIYFNFNINTNKEVRQKCYNILSKKNLSWIPTTNYMDYLKILKSHQFAIAPPGNGIDTHRLWECLYLKVVPICEKSYLTEYFSKIFPIILIDDWNNFNNSLLNEYNLYNFNNYNLLNIDNYINFINIQK